MAKKILQSAKLAASAGIMSHGVEVPVGKMVFVSGQVARDLDGNVVGVGTYMPRHAKSYVTCRRS